MIVGLGLGTAVGGQLIQRSTGTASDKVHDLAGAPVLRVEAADAPSPIWPWAFAEPWPGDARTLPAGPDAFARLVRDHNGVAVERGYERLVVDSRRTATVVITDMRAVVLEKRPPLDGTLMGKAPCGGPEPSLVLNFDLDHGDQAKTADGKRFFDYHHVTLKPSETVVFVVAATTKTAFYKWQIKVDLVVDGKHRTQSIPERAHPLQVTGSARKYHATFRPVDCRGEEWKRLR